MPELLLGPLLRYVDEDSATVWVETSSPCEVGVTTATGVTAASRTWRVEGHHYALVPVTGLRPGTTTGYRVTLDGGPAVWPPPGSPYPPSTIRTLAGDCSSPASPLRITFGSCRWATPHAARWSGRSAKTGPDALDTLAARLAADPDDGRPDVLLLLGDQVYADETSVPVREWLAARRAPGRPPKDQVADFEEYTRLYYESWLDPHIRWLLSTVPSCMIFDDHDVIDDWNTSAAWREEMRATSWWNERVLGGLTSYWVHQHLGNLSPAELADDALYADVREADDGASVLRSFAIRADDDPAFHRWSYRRDFGRVRLLMVDTRTARVLEEGRRAMLEPSQFAWLAQQAAEGVRGDHGTAEAMAGAVAVPVPPGGDDATGTATGVGTAPADIPPGADAGGAIGGDWAADANGSGPDGRNGAARPDGTADGRGAVRGTGPGGRTGPRGGRGGYDHLLIGSSLPWLLPRAIHDTESWNAALCSGGRGPRWTGLAERMRRTADLEHWAAFRTSFDALAALFARIGAGGSAPRTICVLSGDVHHAYLAEAAYPVPLRSRVVQLTCSPVHNAVPAVIRAGFRLGWGRVAGAVGRMLARHGRVPPVPVSWDRLSGPHFGNQLMTLTVAGPAARIRLERAEPDGAHTVLRTLGDIELSPGEPPAPPADPDR